MQVSNLFVPLQSLTKGKQNIGELAEWSNAAVLKTVDLNGSGGSNPSLSALKSLQEIDYQSCRLFSCPKSCTKNAPNPVQRKKSVVLHSYILMPTFCSMIAVSIFAPFSPQVCLSLKKVDSLITSKYVYLSDDSHGSVL